MISPLQLLALEHYASIHNCGLGDPALLSLVRGARDGDPDSTRYGQHHAPDGLEYAYACGYDPIGKHGYCWVILTTPIGNIRVLCEDNPVECSTTECDGPQGPPCVP